MGKKTDRNLPCRSHETGQKVSSDCIWDQRLEHHLQQDAQPGQEDQDLCPGSMPGHTFSWMTEMYQGTRFLG